MAKTFTAILVAILLGVSWHLYKNPHWFVLSSVVIEGHPVHLDREALLKDVKPLLVGNLWQVPIKRLEKVLQQKPWVRNAKAKRKFPHELRIRIDEKVPTAFWGEKGLVDSDGEVFFPETMPEFEEVMPRFFAEDQAKAALVYRQCMDWIGQLAVANIKVNQCGIVSGEAWQLVVNEGMTVVMGVKDLDKRLGRLVTLMPRLQEHFKQGIERLDLRYRLGVAVLPKHA